MGARTYLGYRSARALAAQAFHESFGRLAAASARVGLGGGAGSVPRSPARILAVSLQKIGDAVTTEPALRVLAQRLPEARIEVAAAASRERGPDMGACEVFKLIPQVAAVHPIRRWRDLRALAGQNDLVVTFGLRARDAWGALAARGKKGIAIGYTWRGRGAALDRGFAPPNQVMLTASEALARRAKPQHELWTELLWLARLIEDAELARAGAPRLSVPEAAARDAAALLAEREIGDRFVAVAPWNAQGHYRWPEESWVSLVQHLNPIPVVIVGGHASDEVAYAARLAARARAHAFAGQLSLDRTAALLAKAAAVVAVDSGPAHIARAVGAPTAVLFGPGSPRVWAPPDAKVLQRTDLCHGCRQPRCYQAKRVCLDELSVPSVLEAVRSLLEPAPLTSPSG